MEGTIIMPVTKEKEIFISIDNSVDITILTKKIFFITFVSIIADVGKNYN